MTLNGSSLIRGYSAQFDTIKTLNAFLAQDLPPSLAHEPYMSAFEFLKQWDRDTHIDNRQAALAVLTLYDLLRFDNPDKDKYKIQDSFRIAVDLLISNHGSVDVPYGQVNRHIRGNRSLPISGGPDALRAVYGGPADPEDGLFKNRAGDSYVMFIEWDTQGNVRSQSIHNYGSATLDATSRHYDDQMLMFTEHKLKPMRLNLSDLEPFASRRYRPQSAN